MQHHWLQCAYSRTFGKEAKENGGYDLKIGLDEVQGQLLDTCIKF